MLYFPYFEDRYLAVAAALNGGNALATFVSTVQQWTLELGFNLPQCELKFYLQKFRFDEPRNYHDILHYNNILYIAKNFYRKIIKLQNRKKDDLTDMNL